MKKHIYVLMFAALVLGVAVVFSCSKEAITPDSLSEQGQGEMMLKKGTLSSVPTDVLNVSPTTNCLEYNFTISFSQASSGKSGNLQSTEGQVQMKVNDDWIQIGHGGGSTSFSFIYTFGAPGTYQLRYKASSNDWTYTSLTVEPCCEESFSYVDNGNKTYTFTYIPKENASGAVLVFTFAQSAYQSGLEDGWIQNGQTMQKTMDLAACHEYRWTVSLDAKCSGHSGESNVWTDFKVNDVSKKGELDNIVQVCQ